MNISSEQFRVAYSRLPYPLRDFLAGDDMGRIVSEVGAKYGLHVDTIGAVDRETINMLLGLIDPAQFVVELRSAGIPETSINPLVQELNEKIFMPLHKKMQEPGAAADPGKEDEAIYLEVAHNVGLSTDSVSIATPNPAPVPQQIVVPQTVAAPIQPPVSVTPQPPIPAITPIQMPAPSRPIPPPVQSVRPPMPQPIASPPEEHEVRTMASDMQMMKSGGFHQEQAMPQAPRTFAPAPTPAPLPVSDPISRPVVRPSMPPAQSAISTLQPRVASLPVMPKAPAPQSENRDALHQILKEYGVDPYREPAE